MTKGTICLAALVFMLTTGSVLGQESSYGFSVQTLGGYTTPGVVPFWLRANQFGSIPLNGASLSFIGAARKDYDLSNDKLFDWGASFEGRANLGSGSNLTLIEGYGKVRLGIFELRAGRSKEITGLCDTTLTSGSWAISGSNLGIPEIELSVRDFWTLPWFGQMVAFKGNFSHGWMGNLPMIKWFGPSDTIWNVSYLHQTSAYVRFGKPTWKGSFIGGFNHQVVWCDGQDYYLDSFELSGMQTFYYVITGKRYSNERIQSERLGNHLGTIDIGFNYKFQKIEILVYRQNLYEGGSLAHLANIQDGLNGIVIINNKRGNELFSWRKLLIEFLYTKNQAGQPSSPATSGYYEPYYNHGQFITGWSFNNNSVGTPFISTREFVRQGLAANPQEYYMNNRVAVLHMGSEGTLKKFDYLIKLSWSRNFGTYWTTDEEQSTNIPNPGAYGIFGEQKQWSAYVELHREILNGFNLGILGAFDYGTLLYNSYGLFIKAAYSFSM